VLTSVLCVVRRVIKVSFGRAFNAPVLTLIFIQLLAEPHSFDINPTSKGSFATLESSTNVANGMTSRVHLDYAFISLPDLHE